MKSYSSVFKTLHDEISPNECLGLSRPYSVLRSAAAIQKRRLWCIETVMPYQDFVIIWGKKGYNLKVVEIVEKLYFEALLSPVLFIYEREDFLIPDGPPKSPSRGHFKIPHLKIPKI